MLGCFSKPELTELGKLGKTTQFYLENLVNSEKPISFAQFYLVFLGFTWFCLVLLGFTWFYLVLLGTEQCSWLSEKTSYMGELQHGFYDDEHEGLTPEEINASYGLSEP